MTRSTTDGLRAGQAEEFDNFLQLHKRSWIRIFGFLPRLVLMGAKDLTCRELIFEFLCKLHFFLKDLFPISVPALNEIY